ncbi:hypothetical protein [Paenibacillus sp. YN15]|uniref:hypothetical protein n=1 Tax=Paenibacillus sp. YN15 TaxID=1742774 RepID=UPI000DCEEA98|nr:hypothetical protein [Paenibacillus sp. YN15]RAV03573.1 hypothetical protein DQG13_07685 [Paenibacillus sp. YN15]
MRARISIDASKAARTWPRVERYQNSTLRFAPPADFPAFWAEKHGRPKIMRCWVTLDEVWDYRTDEYFWNYRIGVNRYEDDPHHHEYDWGWTVPSEVHIQTYLAAHSEHCDEILLNLRRYEKETEQGVISLDKYEEVVERVIEHYKNLYPNIRYIEPCNESDYLRFGGIGTGHYYKLYTRAYRAVRKLNERYRYETPLEIGGSAINAVMDRPHLWREFLQHLANDKDERRKIDYYSMHDYNGHPNRMKVFYDMHHAWIKELSLPDLPIFVDEYGFTRTTGIWTDSLRNASGVLSAMILSTRLEGMHLFPWCTFHNPSSQMSFTQYLLLEDGQYASTPNGNAMRMLYMLKTDELEMLGEHHHRVIATGDATGYAVLATNPGNEPMAVDLALHSIPYDKAAITEYRVDSLHNNRLTGPASMELGLTNRWIERVTGPEKGIDLTAVLEPYGFTLWLVEP